MSLDVSSVSPSDAVVALRSYPRRFRGALTSIDPDEEISPEAVAEADAYGRHLALLRNGLGRVVASTSSDGGVVLPAGVMEEAEREWAMAPDTDVSRVLDVLAEEGYIRGYHLVEKPGAFPEFEIELKYFDNQPVIVEISRVSKPGRRVYSSIADLKPVKNGLGISILSTPKGVMSDTAAREANVGGEVLARVY